MTVSTSRREFLMGSVAGSLGLIAQQGVLSWWIVMAATSPAVRA